MAYTHERASFILINRVCLHLNMHRYILEVEQFALEPLPLIGEL